MTPRAITTIDGLHRYLHRAMQLEHATIPPYLTALYSIHPGENAAAVDVLRTVAVEEMLHLTIAANLLNAVGGCPDLTAPGFVPRYPATLPDGETWFEVSLERFSDHALDTFLNIERPAPTPAGEPAAAHHYAERHPIPLATCPLNPSIQYRTIGEFYAEIQAGLAYLASQHGAALFPAGREHRQVTSGYYYSGGGRLAPITDLASAQAGLDLIVEQGEGFEGGIDDPDKELSHYSRFTELKYGRYFQPGDHKDHPTGQALTIEWDKVYPIQKNATVATYRDPELRAAAIAFNTSYAAYLKKLTRAFNGEPELLQAALPMMFDIRNRMTQLMHIPLDDGSGLHAAPTFEIEATGAPA